MRLVNDWRAVLLRAHSMRAFILSFVCLVLPDLIYLMAEIDTNPRLWWAVAAILLAYGIFGRLVDQGIDRARVQSAWMIGLLLLVAIVAVSYGEYPAGMRRTDLPTVVESDAKSPPGNPASFNDNFLRAAVPFVARWEGLRLVAYRDVVGVWTICYGETKGVRAGDSRTKAECDAMLAREIVSYRDGLHKYMSADTRAKRLPLARDVAYTSFAYNVGIAGAGKSTSVRRLNAADVAGACQALTWWNKGGGRVIRGLVARRGDEYELCMRGVA